MGNSRPLGEFEHLVLAAALRLERPYGASIIREIEEQTGRDVQAGSLYITLDRLQDKAFLHLASGQPDPNRGGRPKRFVTVTEAGIQALAEQRRALLRIWNGLEGRLESGE